MSRSGERRPRGPGCGGTWRAFLAGVLTLGLGLSAVGRAQANDACPQPEHAAHGYRLRYDAAGRLLPACDTVLRQVLAAAPLATDIVVFSHGWMNDPKSAEGTYARFISGMLARQPPAAGVGLRPLLVGIYWPSAVFPVSGEDEESLASAPAQSEADLAARIGHTFDWLDGMPGVDRDLHDVARLVLKEARGSPRTRSDFVRLANILKRWAFFARPGALSRNADAEVEAPGERPMMQLEAKDLAQFLLDHSYAGGGEEGIGSREASVLSVLNVFTFWEMKRRAGEIGQSGGHELLAALQAANPAARTHLVGHSFGGKLLLAAIAGKPGATPRVVDSVVILQGAFSHFALSRAADLQDLPTRAAALTEGRYASIRAAASVRGPIVFTHSRVDRPNVLWYPLGVRVAGDALERRDRKPPVYGAMGANGAQRVGALTLQLKKGAPVPLVRPDGFTIINVEATEVIRGHSKYFAPEVYDLIWSVLR